MMGDGSRSGNGEGRNVSSFFQRHSQQGRNFPSLHRNPARGSFPPLAHGNDSEQPLISQTEVDGDAHQDDIPETDYLDPLPIVLGQFVESFVVSADREGVMLVDQHVAHERILYERALRQLESSGPCPTQRLLVPLTHDLSTQQKAIFEKIFDELNDNGFEVEWFGAQTIAIKGVPSFAGDCDARLLIQEILDSLHSSGRELQSPENRLRRLREKIAISLSCRAAIKINTPLSQEKMQWLLDQLFRCHNPFTCPHGRPIVLRVGIEEILRGFKRI